MKIEPKEVDRVFMAFPADVIGKYLPKLEDIPEEFVRGWVKSGGPCGLAEALMMGSFRYKGKSLDLRSGQIGFIPMEGVDPNLAYRHISACLGSYQPRHEHKIAGVGYLISLWFKAFLLDEDVLWENNADDNG